MSNKGSVHLSRNTGVIAATTLNPKLDASKHIYKGYSTQRNKFVHRDIFTPEVLQTVLGTTQVFQILISFDKLGPMQLCFDISDLQVTGGGGGHYLADGYGYSMWDKIVLEYGGNEVETLYPEEIHWKLNNHYDINEQEIREEELVANKSITERQPGGAYAGPRSIIVDLPFSWTKHPHVYQEIRQLGIKPLLKIHWKRVEEFANLDGGTNPVFEISNAHLRCHAIWLEAAERDMNTRICETKHGIVRLRTEFKRDYQTNDAVIPVGFTGEFRKELKNFRSFSRFIAFTLRPRRILTNGTTDPFFLPEYQDIFDSYKMQASGSENIFDPITPHYNKTVLKRQYYSGKYGPNLFFYPFGDDLEDECNADGGYNFNALNNPTLCIDFGTTPTTEELVLTVYVSEYNFNQTNRGNLQKSMTN